MCGLCDRYGTGKLVVEDDVRRKVMVMLRAVLEKSWEYCKSYCEGWLTPVHLFGAVCNEQHRQLFASVVLVAVGKAEELQHALATSGGGKCGSRVVAACVEQVTQPIGWVQAELKRRVLAVEGPELLTIMRRWGLSGQLAFTGAKLEE